jgi:nitroreductase
MTATPDPLAALATLDAFEALVRSRRSVRRFATKAPSDELVARLVDCARLAPSGYNLQPTHVVVVTDPATRRRLAAACMDQRAVEAAPVVAVFVGDRDVARTHADSLQADLDAGAIDAAYAARMRRVVPLAFRTGPLGIGWLWKALLPPFVRWFRPVPAIPAVARRAWLGKQAGLMAMTYLLAARAAGLDAVPMEGFDDRRVRTVLGIPRRYVPLIVVPTGYASDELPVTAPRRTRRPLASILHRERF